ncbi:hypothetical protein AB0C01_00095 [Micromonospora sp. NPDC048905]|uniref:hypothetical protein n=1 Tax=Micromonospora sp. NPDC048905 TaxID=3155494 RepID=UPI0033D9328A
MTERVVLAYSGGLDIGDTFGQSLAKGFVQLWGLPSRMAAARDARWAVADSDRCERERSE